MTLFEPGAEYWLTYEDGSRIKVYARESDREIDLVNDAIEFVMWVCFENLEGIEVQRIN